MDKSGLRFVGWPPKKHPHTKTDTNIPTVKNTLPGPLTLCAELDAHNFRRFRPPTRPAHRAASSPARVRSRISSRSIWARLAIT